ncbi:hypothetical protein Tco_0653431 [Tanacetum coccineum]|uniref:Uncharacterized protein n=1 Tax=Tanacetum coccineum TaxID=301880 RepID=A0ABQ4X0I4_9ASTR
MFIWTSLDSSKAWLVAKLEANAELKESVLRKDLTVEDYVKRMVELNQGTWKLTQLKKLNFKEVKAEFENLAKQLDTYVPMNFEATKESLKRFGTNNSIDPALVRYKKSPSIEKLQSLARKESMDDFEKDVYMLIERKYHLSAEVCKAMLDKKLQGGKPDEDCYKLLKIMEKQAGDKGLIALSKWLTVEMVFSRPWTCTFLMAKGLTTPELMANCLEKGSKLLEDKLELEELMGFRLLIK